LSLRDSNSKLDWLGLPLFEKSGAKTFLSRFAVRFRANCVVNTTHNIFLPCRKTVICYSIYSHKQSKRLYFTVANYRFSLRLLKCKENRLVPLAEQFARHKPTKCDKKVLGL
jgi:hypothetical protein